MVYPGCDCIIYINSGGIDVFVQLSKYMGWCKNYKSAEQFSQDEEFLNNYVFSNQEIKDKIVKDYLSKITQNSPIKVENGGSSITLSPPKVPTTIKEAGKLAKSIIKQK